LLNDLCLLYYLVCRKVPHENVNVRLTLTSRALLWPELDLSVGSHAFDQTIVAIRGDRGDVNQDQIKACATQRSESLMCFSAGLPAEPLSAKAISGVKLSPMFGVVGRFLRKPFDPPPKNHSVSEAVSNQGMTFARNTLIQKRLPAPIGNADNSLFTFDVGVAWWQ
jgi:hypothetical protein